MDIATPAAAHHTQLIDLARVDLPDDARLHDPVEVELLARDIAKNGQLQEIIVTDRDGRYEVVAGVGRVLAARKLAMPQVRAQVRESLSDFQKAAITFSENEHRENTEPFYQAYQLAKMQRAQPCSQRELAAAVGLPETRISEYLSIANLEPAVRENLQRCKFSRAHLLEISRLPTPEQQLAFGQRCHKEDLSLKALKALVNDVLGKPGKAHKVGKVPTRGLRPDIGPDPLAEHWQPLQLQAMTTGQWWGVSYSPQRVPGLKGAALPAWHFWVVNNGTLPKSGLKRWFQQMADAMGDTGQEEVIVKRNMDEWLAQNPEIKKELEAQQAAPQAVKIEEEMSEEEQIRWACEFAAKNGRIG